MASMARDLILPMVRVLWILDSFVSKRLGHRRLLMRSRERIVFIIKTDPMREPFRHLTLRAIPPTIPSWPKELLELVQADDVKELYCEGVDFGDPANLGKLESNFCKGLAACRAQV